MERWKVGAVLGSLLVVCLGGCETASVDALDAGSEAALERAALPGHVQALSDEGKGAIILGEEEGPCYVAPSLSGLPFFLITNELHGVITPSGNRMLTCHFDIPKGFAPKRATKSKDFLCLVIDETTEQTHFVATPGGRATLTCHINGNG